MPSRHRRQEFVDQACGLGLVRARVLEAATGHVLELGGESGTNLALYPRTITSITSLVASRRGQAEIRRAARLLPFSVDRREGPLEAMPAKDHAYDTVVSTLALAGTHQREAALREIHRVLKPGGRLLFVEFGRSELPARQAAQQRWAWLHPWLHGTSFPLPDLAALIGEAGFELRHFEENVLDRLPLGLACVHEGIATSRA